MNLFHLEAMLEALSIFHLASKEAGSGKNVENGIVCEDSLLLLIDQVHLIHLPCKYPESLVKKKLGMQKLQINRCFFSFPKFLVNFNNYLFQVQSPKIDTITDKPRRSYGHNSSIVILS